MSAFLNNSTVQSLAKQAQKLKSKQFSDITDNDGSFSWTIPTNLSNGIYYIRVKTIDNKVLLR